MKNKIKRQMISKISLFLAAFSVFGLVFSLYFGTENEIIAPDAKIQVTKFTLFVMAAFFSLWISKLDA